MTTEEQIKVLEQRIDALEERLRAVDRETIKIVGTVASTTVPVTLNGIRRNITHAAP